MVKCKLGAIEVAPKVEAPSEGPPIHPTQRWNPRRISLPRVVKCNHCEAVWGLDEKEKHVPDCIMLIQSNFRTGGEGRPRGHRHAHPRMVERQGFQRHFGIVKG